MTRRQWAIRLAALLPFAGRFQGPVALGSLRVGERFRFSPQLNHVLTIGSRTAGNMREVWDVGAREVSQWGLVARDMLVYRVR